MNLAKQKSKWGFGLEGVEPFAVYSPENGHPHKDGLNCKLSYGYVTEDGHRLWTHNVNEGIYIQIRKGHYHDACIGQFYNALREHEKKSFVKNIETIVSALSHSRRTG